MSDNRFFSAVAAGLVVAAMAGCSQPADLPQSATQTPPSVTAPSSAATPSADAAVATAPDSGENPSDIVERKLGLTPMESIRDLDRQIESYHLGQNLSSDQMRENTLLKRRIIRGTFDIGELCRQSLAKHWDTITEEQRKHFVELMTELLEKKAIFSKEQLKGDNKYYRISYLSEAFEPEDKTKALVKTRMDVPKKNMDLDITYKMLEKNDVWKIFDVVVDEASLLANYRFQFDRIIQKGGFAELIGRMESKLVKIGGQ